VQKNGNSHGTLSTSHWIAFGKMKCNEGEVPNTVQETEDPLSGPTSYGRTISHVGFCRSKHKGYQNTQVDPTVMIRLSKEGVTVVRYLLYPGAVKR
jgi:hypothetical protein